ncbi:MAG: methyltransferase [Jatrophihabitantaceae bacterium]
MTLYEEDEGELFGLTDLLRAKIATLIMRHNLHVPDSPSELCRRIARYAVSDADISEALRYHGDARLARLNSLAASAAGPGRNEFLNRLRCAVLELERTDLTTGTSAYRCVHGADFYQDLDSRAAWDDSWTRLMSLGAAEIAEEVLGNISIGLSSPTAVDLGGGDGTFIATLAQRRTDIERALVLERPSVTKTAERLFVAQGLDDRCAAVAGDLLSDPLPAADVYFLVSVLHEWPDNDAVRILQNVRAAMSDSGELILVERVFDSGRDDAELVASLDMMMLAFTAGRERTVGELSELCRAAELSTPKVSILESGRAVLRVTA